MQTVPFDILLEISKYLELPYYHRMRQTCRSMYYTLSPNPALSFEAYKRHILLNFDKSKFSIRSSIPNGQVALLFMVKQRCIKDFLRFYTPNLSAQHKQIMLEYCADRCSILKAEMALYILTGKELIESGSVRLVCILKSDEFPGSSSHFLTESELVLSGDWSPAVTNFRLWFKSWYQVSHSDSLLEIKAYTPAGDLIESVELCKTLRNPLKADIAFAKASLIDGDVEQCKQIFNDPLVTVLGERPSLFQIAIESQNDAILDLFLNKCPSMTLAYYILKSTDGLDIPLLINSGRFDVAAADNLALEVACRKRFDHVIDLLLKSPLLFLSKSWKASPIRILFDNGFHDRVLEIMKGGITNTGAEVSVFRRCIQKGNVDILKVFLDDTSGRFDPSSGGFKLLRLATKHPVVLSELLKDPRCAKLPIVDLVPQFPSVPFGNEITEILAKFVFKAPERDGQSRILKSVNLVSLYKIACATGHLNLIKLLISQTGSFHPKIYFLSLDAACFNGHLDLVQFLVADALVEPKPLHVLAACTSGHADVVSFLLNGGYLKDLDMEMIHIGSYHPKVNRVLYEFENKLWASSFEEVMSVKFRQTPFKKLRLI